MPVAKIVTSQTDFSLGEIDPELKRDGDSDVNKRGLRQCLNFRILNSKKLTNRLGRTAKFIDGPRVDEVLMSPGSIFYLVFGNGYLSVYNAAGTRVFNSTKLGDGSTTVPWTTATVKNVRWDVYQFSIYIAYADGFPANVPQILTWDGVSQTSTWTLTTYAEQVIGNQKRTPFYRISPIGVTLAVGATTGSGVTATASSAIFTAAHVGTRIRYAGRQMLITAVTSPPSTTATVTIEETLFPSINVTTNSATDIRTILAVGDIVIGAVSGCKIQVASVSTALIFNGQMLSGNFPLIAAQDVLVGPGGSVGTATAYSISTPSAITIWDDEVMNAFRGYPSSVAVDQGRLIFSNFPSVPSGISWSAIGVLIDLYVPPVGIVTDNAIFEITPGKNQVQDVVAGNEGSEFVFCDNSIFGIPVNAQNPLSGSTGVNFQKITDDGASNVQPRRMQNVIVYINAGGKSVRAIMTVGAYNRANESRDLTENHSHLINSPIAIACPTANEANLPERYFYILNADNSIAVGRVDVSDGNIKPNTLPGFVPENGVGTVKWISARASNVMFTTTYAPGGAAAKTIAELRDFTQYLDGAFLYNSVPTPFVTGGKGPLFWIAGGTCTVLDLGTRQMGLYQIDANGFLIPQNFGGENLSSAQLMVGQAWTATAEPFIPSPPAGQDVMQRFMQRQVSQAGIYFKDSTGFLWQYLFSGRVLPLTASNYVAPGAPTQTRRVATYNQDDDPTLAPPLREFVDTWRPAGSSYDPRIAIVKDTSGPLTILEIAFEVSV
jgi:hypothetical protein